MAKSQEDLQREVKTELGEGFLIVEAKNHIPIAKYKGDLKAEADKYQLLESTLSEKESTINEFSKKFKDAEGFEAANKTLKEQNKKIAEEKEKKISELNWQNKVRENLLQQEDFKGKFVDDAFNQFKPEENKIQDDKIIGFDEKLKNFRETRSEWFTDKPPKRKLPGAGEGGEVVKGKAKLEQELTEARKAGDQLKVISLTRQLVNYKEE